MDPSNTHRQNRNTARPKKSHGVWGSKQLPSARQILRINNDGTNLGLDHAALKEVFHQVPKNMKVAVISIAGPMRTGKSFFLDLCLRYLRYTTYRRQLVNDTSNDEWKRWIYAGINGYSDILEGGSNTQAANGSEGFSWQSGYERNTSGIWIWDKPFYRKSKTGETIAVFLVDTQGLFDFESSQMLITRIFGLSALLSSYQIYNVDKRVQEDNLQHLAMFAEFGRMAFEDKKNKMRHNQRHQREYNNMDGVNQRTKSNADEFQRPFQHLSFLVRDWPNFPRNKSIADYRKNMMEYRKNIFKVNDQSNSDVKHTRDHIAKSFERISCFLLPHPGLDVSERDYDGSVSAFTDQFLRLITVYFDDLFGEKYLDAKKIHGVYVTSEELCTYFQCYVNLFQKSENFPKLHTMLEATAEIHFIHAIYKAIDRYKCETSREERRNGPSVSLRARRMIHSSAFNKALSYFDEESSRMGRHLNISHHRKYLIELLNRENPLHTEGGAQTDALALALIIPIIAIGGFIFL